MDDNVVFVDLTDKQRKFLKGKAMQHFRDGGLDCQPEEAFDKLSDWYAQYHGAMQTVRQLKDLKLERYRNRDRSEMTEPFKLVRRPAKGLILFGEPGCGKTSVSRLLKRGPVFEGTNIPRWTIPMYHSYTLVEEYTEDGANWWNAFQQRHGVNDIVIDDVGSEENAKWMGHQWTMMTFLKWRYDCWVNTGALTIITTNFESVNQMVRTYVRGIKDSFLAKTEFNRVAGRILEMTEPVHYKGILRRPDPLKENSQGKPPKHMGVS